VAKEWPCPKDEERLHMMRKDVTKIEGFVIAMKDGSFIKWKTDWWRKQRFKHRTNLIQKSDS
jgi:hypothetical protein